MTDVNNDWWAYPCTNGKNAKAALRPSFLQVVKQSDMKVAFYKQLDISM